MANTNLKQRKISMTDEEYNYNCAMAKKAGLPFSTYARKVLMDQKVSTEAPLHQELAKFIPVYINTVNELISDADTKNKFIELENILWQLIK